MTGKIMTIRDIERPDDGGYRWLWGLCEIDDKGEPEGMVCDCLRRQKTREEAIQHAKDAALAILAAIEEGRVK